MWLNYLCEIGICFVQEVRLDHVLQSLATHVAPIYQRVAPDSYYNQVSWSLESVGSSNMHNAYTL